MCFWFGGDILTIVWVTENTDLRINKDKAVSTIQAHIPWNSLHGHFLPSWVETSISRTGTFWHDEPGLSSWAGNEHSAWIWEVMWSQLPGLWAFPVKENTCASAQDPGGWHSFPSAHSASSPSSLFIPLIANMFIWMVFLHLWVLPAHASLALPSFLTPSVLPISNRCTGPS